MRTISRCFRYLDYEAYNSVPLFARAAGKGKACWLQRVVGLPATISALLSLTGLALATPRQVRYNLDYTFGSCPACGFKVIQTTSPRLGT